MSADVVLGWLVMAPVAVPLTAAGLAVMVMRHPLWQRGLTLVSLAATLALALLLLLAVGEHDLPLVVQLGSWAPPFGIALVADTLGAGLVLVSLTVGFLCAVYMAGDMNQRSHQAAAYPLLLALLTGVNGMFLTGDVFNMYVWFEIMLIAALGLMVVGGERLQIDGALKYAALNLVATTLFLIATALLYGTTGTLNLADLSLVVAEMGGTPQLTAIGLLYVISIGMKAAMFPLMGWLPASYHTPATTVMAVFGALLTKAGFYVMLRLLGVVFQPQDFSLLYDVLLITGAFTALVGAAGALSEPDLRKIGSYVVIGGIGFLLLSLGLGTAGGLAAASAYAVHSMLATCLLLLAIGLIIRRTGHDQLSQVRGMMAGHPLLSIAVLIGVFALIGLPPFSGFWPKLMIVQAGLADEGGTAGVFVVVVILVYSLLTTLALGRVWAAVFWRPLPEGASLAALPRSCRAPLLVPVVALALVVSFLGIWAEPYTAAATRAGADLAFPQGYVTAVSPCRGGDCPVFEAAQALGDGRAAAYGEEAGE